MLHFLSSIPRTLNFIEHTSDIGWKELHILQTTFVSSQTFVSSPTLHSTPDAAVEHNLATSNGNNVVMSSSMATDPHSRTKVSSGILHSLLTKRTLSMLVNQSIEKEDPRNLPILGLAVPMLRNLVRMVTKRLGDPRENPEERKTCRSGLEGLTAPTRLNI